MSAESAHQAAHQVENPKKRSFDTISQKKPSVFTFPNSKVALNRQRPSHHFNAVPNEYIKSHYGVIHTPKGGKHVTRRHKTLRHKTPRHCARRSTRRSVGVSRKKQ